VTRMRVRATKVLLRPSRACISKSQASGVFRQGTGHEHHEFPDCGEH